MQIVKSHYSSVLTQEVHHQLGVVEKLTVMSGVMSCTTVRMSALCFSNQV